MISHYPYTSLMSYVQLRLSHINVLLCRSKVVQYWQFHVIQTKSILALAIRKLRLTEVKLFTQDQTTGITGSFPLPITSLGR